MKCSLTAQQTQSVGGGLTRKRSAGTMLVMRKGCGVVPRRVATYLPDDMRHVNYKL